MEKKDYYKVLGIPSSATSDEIRKAFLKKNLENHPDKLGINETSDVWDIANEYIKSLNEAYHVLSDKTFREKYDIENGFKNFEENFSEKKQNSYADKNINRKTPIIFNYENLSGQLKNIVKHRQNSDHLYKIKTKGVLSSYFISIVLFMWVPILYSLSDSHQWQDDVAVIYYIISIIVSIILYRLILFIFKWHKSELKWNLLVTPLYFIITEFEKIIYFYLWDLKDVKATNNYKNGSYQDTSVVLYIGDFTYSASFPSEKEYKNFVSLVDIKIKTAIHYQNNHNFEYFIKNDDLLNINNPPAYTKNKNKFLSTINYGIPILISFLITSIFYNINKEISNSPHYVPPSPYYSNDDNYTFPKNSSNNFNEAELPLPRNGSVEYYTSAEPRAPLRIITQSNSNYYVKLENYYSGEIVESIFIRAYETIDVNVPLGSYSLKYATGEKWYGEKYLFGPYTNYNKATSRFDFELIGNQYSGYTVELFLQANGNLHTQEISPKDF